MSRVEGDGWLVKEEWLFGSKKGSGVLVAGVAVVLVEALEGVEDVEKGEEADWEEKVL